MFENKYPYTNFHELNLDWFLSEFKKVYDHVDDLDATVHEFTEFVTNYFNNLDVQEEINKKLDAMAADGSLSALIQPLFDEYKEDIDDVMATQNSKITVLESRMDSFASLTEGSTTGDAELIDGRVGYNGTTYASIGDAIRTQVEELTDFIGINDTLEPGYIDNAGAEAAQGITKELLTAFYYPCNIGDTFTLKYTFGGTHTAASIIVYYDADQNLLTREYMTSTTAGSDVSSVKQIGYINGVAPAFVRIFFSGYDDIVDYNISVSPTIYEKVVDNTKAVSEIELIKHDIGIIEISPERGYYASNLVFTAPTGSNEMTTQPIPAGYGSKNILDVYFKSTHGSAWAVATLFDGNGCALRRDNMLITGDGTAHHTYTYEVTDPATRYIRLSYRGYVNPDTAHYAFHTDNIHKNLAAETYVDYDLIAVKGINHRGYNSTAPENTLEAFKISKLFGFKYVETDVRFTSDEVAVLLHDASINRTARNADGTAVVGTVDINSITYAQSQDYDFGLYKSAVWEGVKIPKFEDFLHLCKTIGLHPYIELKYDSDALRETHSKAVVDLVAAAGMKGKVTYIGYSSALHDVIALDPDARIGLTSYTCTASELADAISMKTGTNEVFYNQEISGITDSIIADLAANDIPLETWTVDNETTIKTMKGYISGVTSNSKNAPIILYNDNIGFTQSV